MRYLGVLLWAAIEASYIIVRYRVALPEAWQALKFGYQQEKLRKAQAAAEAAERLDRLRNPAKYRPTS